MSKRSLYGTVYKTNYDGLGFVEVTRNVWQHVDTSEPGDPAQVGPQYRTKLHLMIDSDRYCAEYGARRLDGGQPSNGVHLAAVHRMSQRAAEILAGIPLEQFKDAAGVQQAIYDAVLAAAFEDLLIYGSGTGPTPIGILNAHAESGK